MFINYWQFCFFADLGMNNIDKKYPPELNNLAVHRFCKVSLPVVPAPLKRVHGSALRCGNKAANCGILLSGTPACTCTMLPGGAL